MNKQVLRILEIIVINKQSSFKATEPDAEAKGLQSRATFKNGIYDGRNKKPSAPPDWATIRLGHAWNRSRRTRHVTLLANLDPEFRRVRRSTRTRQMEK